MKKPLNNGDIDLHVCMYYTIFSFVYTFRVDFTGLLIANLSASAHSLCLSLSLVFEHSSRANVPFTFFRNVQHNVGQLDIVASIIREVHARSPTLCSQFISVVPHAVINQKQTRCARYIYQQPHKPINLVASARAAFYKYIIRSVK